MTDCFGPIAVTLEGTVIHKSGLITGGKSTHGSGRKWEEQEVQGLKRQQELYISQLRELQKSKPRGQVEESLTAEMSRLESSLTVARDDLVRHFSLFSFSVCIILMRVNP